MPWNWPNRQRQSLEAGGNLGTTKNALQVKSWPNYDAEYLQKRLGVDTPDVKGDKYNWNDQLGNVGDVVKYHTYLNHISKDYKEEADDCLKQEFKMWLTGDHIENLNSNVYVQEGGMAPRRAIFPVKEIDETGAVVQRLPGDKLTRWRPTWWNRSQLTHLDGVRPFLREEMNRAKQHEYEMNMLAELGPQNLQEAWMYFKHWVKGRPVGPDVCPHGPSLDEDPTFKDYKGRNGKGRSRSKPYDMTFAPKMDSDAPRGTNDDDLFLDAIDDLATERDDLATEPEDFGDFQSGSPSGGEVGFPAPALPFSQEGPTFFDNTRRVDRLGNPGGRNLRELADRGNEIAETAVGTIASAIGSVGAAVGPAAGRVVVQGVRDGVSTLVDYASGAVGRVLTPALEGDVIIGDPNSVRDVGQGRLLPPPPPGRPRPQIAPRARSGTPPPRRTSARIAAPEYRNTQVRATTQQQRYGTPPDSKYSLRAP